MTTKTQRDLSSDLALIKEATYGYPWSYHRDRIYNINGDTVADVSGSPKVEITFITEVYDGWTHAIERAINAEAEVERLRTTLERMDDRKNPMMPRSVMARIAKEALDYGTTQESTA